MDDSSEEDREVYPHCSRARAGRTAAPAESGDSVKILFDGREGFGLLHLSQSDCSFDRSQTSSTAPSRLLRRSNSDRQMQRSIAMEAPKHCSACFEEDGDERLSYTSGSEMTILTPSCLAPIYLSMDNSLSTNTLISELAVTESQFSGYTTESSYQTAAGSAASLAGNSQQPGGADNHIREIHVGVEPTLNVNQIQTIRNDLRQLLSSEVAVINQTSGGNRGAVYLIAYQFM